MKPVLPTSLFGAVLLVACANTALGAPDEDMLGRARGYPIGTAMQFSDESVRVGRFSNAETLFRHNTLAKADSPRPLKKAKAEPAFRYSFNGKSYSVDDYLQHQRITGLLIIKDGEVQVERYQYERKPTHRFISQSMVKSITSLAVGFALDEGKIKSLDDKVARYVPELAGFPYGDTSIRNMLRMASGVKFTEDYGGRDDISRFAKIREEKSLVAAAQAFGEREAKEGTRFHYATSETYVLGLVLKAATGQTLSDYVDEKLWQPMGAESDAKWIIDRQGLEYSGSGFNAVLRDYGRLGVLLANDGMLDGKQVLPKSYLLEATDWHKQPDSFAPGKATPFFGYGYQFWILPGEKRRFALLGIYGQMIYVDPELKLVVVQTAVAKNASVREESMGAEFYNLWSGLVQKYKPAITKPNIPAGIDQMLERLASAWASQNMDEVMAQYHPRYGSSTAKDIAAMRNFFVTQLVPVTKGYELKVTEIREDANLAYVAGVVNTDVGEFPFISRFIKEGERWYILGNQPQKAEK